ncbi:MAG: alpha-glucosidase C-terminal domain-containing protein [Phycisphaeraceae bacterium]|nr:alpha-glucosidase C-terminal domain-containing protein [Phycisphaeraceae bacterium]
MVSTMRNWMNLPALRGGALACLGLVITAFLAPAVHAQGNDFPPDLPVAEISADVAERPGRLPPSVTAVRSKDDPSKWAVTFTVESREPVETMTIAGSFNAWNAGRTPMRRMWNAGARPSVWSVTLDLPDGDHWYKFVANGSRWMHDPRNPDHDHDGHGGRNSRLRLGATANVDPSTARRGDGRIEAAALGHDPRVRRDRDLRADGGARLRVRTLAGDVESVELVVKGAEPISMTPFVRTGAFEWWEADVPAALASQPYTFVFADGGQRVRHPRIHEPDARPSSMFTTPDWARDAIWYQVMVDRFRNGDPSNDPDPVRPWRSDWYSTSPWEGRDGQTFWQYFVFDRLYGGDIAGLKEKLPYLRDLGVNALYLMPMFQAPGPHKYNATNFLHIDEHFGTRGDYKAAEAAEDLLDPSTWTWTESDRKFLDFIRVAKSMGFKVIIDGVFNHTGTEHPAFRDVRAKGKESRFADWYEITSWEPFDYEGWWGFKSLPVFRKDETNGIASDSLREHIFAVTRRWMDPNGDGDPSDGIDGWRLDVPNEVPIVFWTQWRELVKSINPNAYVSGEIWTRAEEYLGSQAFDAVMNYEFAKPAIAWVANREQKLTASEVDRRFAELRLVYPAASIPVMQNLLDSHDTDRIASMIKNPDRPYNERNREQEGHPYDSGRPDPEHYRRQRLLALMQMTHEGAPMIYYGAEVGMWGASDPVNRKPMLWKDLEPYEEPEENFVDKEMLAFYRAATRLRHDHSALRRGSFRTILTDDAQDVWVFLREDEREQVLVAFNAGERAAVITLPSEFGERWKPVFGEAEGPEGDPDWPRTEIPPVAGRVWARPK